MSEPTIHPHDPRVESTDAGRTSERRGGQRRPVAYVRCFTPAPVVVFNVSRQGVAIESFRSFERGENIFLTAEVDGRPQRAVGNVRWCCRIASAGTSNSPVYHVGIQLANSKQARWLSALQESAEH